MAGWAADGLRRTRSPGTASAALGVLAALSSHVSLPHRVALRAQVEPPIVAALVAYGHDRIIVSRALSVRRRRALPATCVHPRLAVHCRNFLRTSDQVNLVNLVVADPHPTHPPYPDVSQALAGLAHAQPNKGPMLPTADYAMVAMRVSPAAFAAMCERARACAVAHT